MSLWKRFQLWRERRRVERWLRKHLTWKHVMQRDHTDYRKLLCETQPMTGPHVNDYPAWVEIKHEPVTRLRLPE